MAFVDPFALGAPAGATVQNSVLVPVDTSATALLTGTNLKGAWLNVRGINGAITLEINKTGAGTCNFEVQATLDSAGQASDNSLIVSARYALLGSAGALSIVVASTAVAGGAQQNWVSVFDSYSSIRVLVSNVAGSVSVATRFLLTPQ